MASRGEGSEHEGLDRDDRGQWATERTGDVWIMALRPTRDVGGSDVKSNTARRMIWV